MTDSKRRSDRHDMRLKPGVDPTRRDVLQYKGGTVIVLSLQAAMRRLEAGKSAAEVMRPVARALAAMEQAEPLEALLTPTTTANPSLPKEE